MYQDALENLESAFEAAARHGSITAHVLASTYRAEVHLRRGAFAEAEADALAAVELIDEHRLQIPAALAFAWLVKAMIERGKVSEGWEVIRERGFDQAIPDRHVFAMLYEARSLLHMVDHRTDRALSDALEAGRLLAALGPGPTPLGGVRLPPSLLTGWAGSIRHGSSPPKISSSRGASVPHGRWGSRSGRRLSLARATR
jgi:hypothetical protein